MSAEAAFGPLEGVYTGRDGTSTAHTGAHTIASVTSVPQRRVWVGMGAVVHSKRICMPIQTILHPNNVRQPYVSPHPHPHPHPPSQAKPPTPFRVS